MELKDKLKALRLEQGLTQAQLAEKLFVSRSTVAKWENGLGLPNEESMKLLEELFGITQAQIATWEPEAVIVEKNRKLRLTLQMIGWISMLALVTVCCTLPFAIHSGDYGFTPEMVAGPFRDNHYIDTGDYRIYYTIFEGDWENGRHWSDLLTFKPVQKHLWGCTVSDKDDTYRVFTKDNYVVGRIYTIEGRDGYYNLLKKAPHYKAPGQPGNPMIWDIPGELITAVSVTIGGVEYELQNGFFFVTQEPVEYFQIGDDWFDVE